MRVYSETSANEIWQQLASDLLNEKNTEGTDSRLGVTREILHAVVEIADPTQRWVLARLPPINPAFALAEVVWVITGRDDTAFLTHWFPEYPSFVGNDPKQYGAYGARLRHHSGLDQLERAYLALLNNPESRQVVLQIWSAAHDLPDHNGGPQAADIPCNLMSTLKIRNGRLEWMQTVRSNDIDRGVPYNIVQFTALQEVMAGWLGIDVGTYVHVIDSLHWYPQLSARMSIDTEVNPAPNTDRFREPFEASRAAFQTLASAMDDIVIARNNDSRPKYRSELGLPQSYENIYALVAADDARRYGNWHGAALLSERCDNPVLNQLWERWVHRTSISVPHSRR